MIASTALSLVMAAGIDATLGEPPNALHPVAWMGTVIARGTKLAPSRGPRRQLAYGVLLASLVPTAFGAAAWLALRPLETHPAILLVATALLLKPTFAVRALGSAAFAVRDALARGDVPAARVGLSSLCSRDARALDASELAAATIESIAENTSDSVVAPLFYFALFGVPGAVAYRAVNTLDAMIGYHGRYEWLGKASARLDDLLNLAPARLTALLLTVAGAFHGGDARRGLRVAWRDHARTESPNAGWPMAAMAGLLDVSLTKDAHYTLGDGAAPLDAAAIDRAWRIVRAASWSAVALAVGVALVTGEPHVAR